MTAVHLVQIIPPPPDGGQVVGGIGRALATILSSDVRLADALGHPMPVPPMGRYC